ncbi:high mobility group box 3 [Binucleata daphniae]
MAKKAKSSNAPKRPATAYIQFCKTIREKDEEIKKTPVFEQGPKLGKMWQELSENEKEKYKQEYIKLKETYDIEFEAYKETDEYKKEKEEKEQEKAKKGKVQKKKVSTGEGRKKKVIKEEL